MIKEYKKIYIYFLEKCCFLITRDNIKEICLITAIVFLNQ